VITDYQYKTKPFNHQRSAFERSRDLKAFALFLEQGTGKSKIVIDNAAYLFQHEKIDCFIVVAPKGVHQNWPDNELPLHMPDWVGTDCFTWESQKAKNKGFQKKLKQFLEPPTETILKCFFINIDAIQTKAGYAALKYLLRFRNSLLVLDESQTIKSPSAKRTKEMIKLGSGVRFKRVLTGTPITQGPLDIYTQMEFLDPYILEFGSFYSFRARYADLYMDVNWQTCPFRQSNILPCDRDITKCLAVRPKCKRYETVQAYKNLEELTQKLDPHSLRVTKEDCLDLPPKLYQKAYVELSPEQRNLYNTLKTELIAEFEGKEVSAALMLTRMLRLQQITGGFFPTDEDGEPLVIPSSGRFAVLTSLLENIPLNRKAIIWARFTAEIKYMEQLIKEKFGDNSVVTYYGATAAADRMENVNKFQLDPTARFFIGNPKAGGRGLTLHAASTVIYYSNDFSLETRLQSEDRAHRIGQELAVTYIDMIARGTLDARIVRALRTKKNIADQITGDNIKEWM
jgi:SNF2 family DNA or RNA helicase